ncbi:SDR family NAD(P)-dependent oxidoreductase [Methylophaga sp.]|jgi:NAD(P)-dependent dehydrogenase (short-subunit alcohol dehydrogenase family)|uniref:SDR family NAD(P)-dependent oxidoreductase n=1 Tax=Methylophaga sp. TaxID=2024840 RepID=UPI003A8F82FC
MNISKRFEGHTVLITGGGGDIGLAIAKRLAREGAAIALLDIDTRKLSLALDTLLEINATAESYLCDITNVTALEKTLKEILERFGSIEMLFNNAGYQGEFLPIHKQSDEEFNKVININVVGAFNVLRLVSAHMVDRQHGSIVNTASMAGVQGPPNMAAYSASKFSVVGLTETASKDLAPYGIRVNAISPAFVGPGFMWDRQVKLQAEVDSQYYANDPDEVARQMIASVPMRRYGTVEEIAGAVSYLFSDDASYITGVNIHISGGIN